METILKSILTGTQRLTIAFTFLLGFLALGQLPAFALQKVTLAWDPSADPTVVGYNVYYGAASGAYTNKVNTGAATSATISNLVEGVTYYFAVTAYNSAALESDLSNEISYTVPLAPTISLSAPTNGATYQTPAAISLSASPTANTHSLTKVQFYQGTTLLGENSAAPYTFLWSGVTAGSYSLTTRLVYDSGSTVDSTAVSVTVTNPPPAIALTAPTKGAAFLAPATINLSVAATANGHTLTKVQFYSGATLLGESTSAPYGWTWNNVAAGSYALTARLVYDSNATLDSAATSITVTNPLPVITLTAPANGATFSAPTTITCTANVTANGHGITKVQYYNGTVLLGETATAPYSFAWNCSTSGLYSVKARLVFDSGSTLDSAAASITVKPSPPLNSHIVTIVGSGTVTPNLNAQSLVVGNTYSVTAVPDAGQEFAGWSGSLTSSSPTLKFVLTSNFNVKATFVAAATKASPGSYYGLFYESNRVEQASSGAFILSTTKRGRYSGYLQLGNTHLPFHGQLDSQGQATNNLVRRDQSPLALQFNLVGGAQADQIQGTVSADTWVAGLTADRAGFSPKSNPTSLQGAYTLLLPGLESNNPALPFGHSFGLVNVDAGGRVRLTASLADGSRLTQSAPLSSRGVWGLYAPLYGGQGSLLSWLAFTNRPTDDFHGALSWIKPANSRTQRYAGGFTNDCQAFGSAYTAPTAHHPLSWNLTNAVMSFTGGELTTDFANFLALSASGHWDNQSTNRLSLSISRNTGAFRGNVTDPASGKVLPFAGILFQKTQSGYGFLLGPSQSSQVSLTQHFE
jgi:hypothetical protein